MEKELKCVQKVYDRKARKFGIKEKGKKEWWMEPQFDEVEDIDHVGYAWFLLDGKYGLADTENRSILISAEYAYPLYFYEDGYSIAWKDYKAGVINLQNEAVIPIIYDDVYVRTETVIIPEENRKIIVDKDGNEKRVGSSYNHVFRGFYCTTFGNEWQIYDEHIQPATPQEFDEERLVRSYEWHVPEDEHRSVAEIEAEIRKEYTRLLQMGYHDEDACYWDREYDIQVANQEALVKNLIFDRRHLLNANWKHTPENAKRIARMNDLLMKAVAKAIKLGKKTAESLKWMEKVPNTARFYVEVCVQPEWEDDKSYYDYVPKEANARKERERLIEQIDDVAPTHIWNIIAALGMGGSMDHRTSAWEERSYEYNPAEWDFKNQVMDDGQSWDEGIHYPAYQDVYFTHPFHQLYCDGFDYAFVDLCNINDFRVKVNVRLETREQSKR